MWLGLAILSALCLGFYDVSKKQSLNANSVLGVLTSSIMISAGLLGLMWLASVVWPERLVNTMFYVPSVDGRTHALIVGKAALVLSSWVCAYIALKHLPISLVAPMQTTRPIWTLLGAIVIFGECLNGWQWLGILTTIGSVCIYALVERRKASTAGTVRPVYVLWLILGILLGSASGLYDKFLMRQLDHNAVQVYYTCYQALMMLLLVGVSRLYSSSHHRTLSPFQWRWSIVGISFFLVLSDFFYLLALSHPQSLIAIVSTTRRLGTIVPFVYGICILHEPRALPKIWCLCGIIMGMVFILIGTV